MIALSPGILVGAANAFAGVGDLSRSKGSPVAQMIRRTPAFENNEPWSTAFLWHVGYWSHFDHGLRKSSWPLPPTADPNALVRYADRRGACHCDPRPNDLFALWSPLRTLFIRAGIILYITGHADLPDGKYYECTTLEADTDYRGAATGPSTHCMRRYLSADAGDRFIRWVDLPPSATGSAGDEQ